LRAAVFLFAAFVSTAGADEVVERPAVKPGDTWVYRRMNYLTNIPQETYELTVTFVGNDAIHASVFVDKPGQRAVLDSDGRTIPDPMPGQLDTDATWTSSWGPITSLDGAVFQGDSGGFRFPLKPGDTYPANFEIRRPREGTFHVRHQRVVSVKGWEDVEVAAGKFRALRVELEGSLERIDRVGPATTRWVIWYVPGVKRWVKLTFQVFNPRLWQHTGEELVSFDLK
jgi:hypothetical protein